MRWRNLALAICFVPQVSAAVLAQEARKPSVEDGRLLLKENRCNGACHQSHSEDNDPLTLYTRENRKAHNRPELDAQVNKCAANLGLMLFPEDLESVSAALDHDYYKFK
jgi:hypothetical protein